MKVVGFDWDEGNQSKCQKHGVSIAEIEEVLKASPRVAPDVAHSADEGRFIAVGRTASGRALICCVHLSSGRPQPVDSARKRTLHAQEGGRSL